MTISKHNLCTDKKITIQYYYIVNGAINQEILSPFGGDVKIFVNKYASAIPQRQIKERESFEMNGSYTGREALSSGKKIQ